MCQLQLYLPRGIPQRVTESVRNVDVLLYYIYVKKKNQWSDILLWSEYVVVWIPFRVSSKWNSSETGQIKRLDCYWQSNSGECERHSVPVNKLWILFYVGIVCEDVDMLDNLKVSWAAMFIHSVSDGLCVKPNVDSE